MDSTRTLVIHSDDIEPFIHPDDPGYQSQHVLGRESAGVHDTFLNRGTVAPRYSLGGGNHPDNVEVYVGLSGRCLVDLGGDPTSGEGGETFRIREGSIVNIPAGTFHRLRNDTDEPFVLLTIWPQPAAKGANGIHDARLEQWGTGFRLRDGRSVETGSANRVVNPDDGDPLQAG
jgi:mannose-6-phosphate isomerase-like protein (cupin superfamily)